MSFDLSVARLNEIADDFERGSLGARGFCQEVVGLSQGFEGVADEFCKEALDLRIEVIRAIDNDKADEVDITRLVNWLRDWTSRLPTFLAISEQ
jgi:hypothetical protein